jgi:hypothetical protein
MDDEKEWKGVNYLDFTNIYEVSTHGEVRRTKTKRVLKPCNRVGYPSITLCKNNKKTTANIHRLIALTFITNIENLPVVNHKNGIKSDNKVINLEWCTYKTNTSHAITTKLTKPSTKMVEQYSYDGTQLIETFNSIREAEKKTGVGNRMISQVCRGKQPTAHGWRWKYVKGFEYITKSEVDGQIINNFPNYMITPCGKVYSIRSKRYLIQNPSGDYNYVKLCNNGKQKDMYIHVLVATYFIQNLNKNNNNNNNVVNHINSNKRDNRKENLEWTTSSGNMKHHIKTRQNKSNSKLKLC